MRLAAALLLAALPALAHAQAEPVTVTPILTTTDTDSGQPLALPASDAQVTVSHFEVAPGARLPVHKHPFQRMGYILSGSLVVANEEIGEETTYDAGEVVMEVVDTWHYGRNDGTTPVELLVIDLAPEGQSNTVLRGN